MSFIRTCSRSHLKSYFLSENGPTTKKKDGEGSQRVGTKQCKPLRKVFKYPLFDVYPSFYNSLSPAVRDQISCFKGKVLVLRLLYDHLHHFWRIFIDKFVNICEIKSSFTLKDLSLENTVSDSQLFTGIVTNGKINRLLDKKERH